MTVDPAILARRSAASRKGARWRRTRMKPLARTVRADRLLRFIAAHSKTHGRSPTYAQMRVHMGLAPSASNRPIAQLLRLLERLGLIERRPGWRGIVVLNGGVSRRTYVSAADQLAERQARAS